MKKKIKKYTNIKFNKRKKHFMKGFYQCCYNHWINWQRGWLPWLPCSVDGQTVAWQQPCACSIWDKNADWLGNKEDCTKGIYTAWKFPWIQVISNKMKELKTEDSDKAECLLTYACIFQYSHILLKGNTALAFPYLFNTNC